MDTTTSDVLNSRLRYAAFALASEHFPEPVYSDESFNHDENHSPPSSSHDVALALLDLPYTRGKKGMVKAMRRRFPGLSQQVIHEWRYMCAQIIKALEDEADSIIQDPSQPPMIDATTSTDCLDVSTASRLTQLASSSPSLSSSLPSKTQESGSVEEDDGTPMEATEANAVEHDQEEQTPDALENVDRVSSPPFALETQLTLIPTASVAVVEPAEAEAETTSADPPSPLPSTSNNAPVVGPAQDLALDAVSSSVHCGSSSPSVCGVEPSTLSLGTGTSAVPSTLGKRVSVAADAPVEGSSSDSEEGGRRTPKRSRFHFWGIFSSFQS